MASKMLEDEEYCMQIDAHMDFVPHWDVKMLKMWADTGTNFNVHIYICVLKYSRNFVFKINKIYKRT
jgi:hypothetical protein